MYSMGILLIELLESLLPFLWYPILGSIAMDIYQIASASSATVLYYMVVHHCTTYINIGCTVYMFVYTQYLNVHVHDVTGDVEVHVIISTCIYLFTIYI